MKCKDLFFFTSFLGGGGVRPHQRVRAWQRSNTHGQVFQLQLADSVVGFDVLRHQSELEVGLPEDAVPLLPLRPVLGTFDLKVGATETV